MFFAPTLVADIGVLKIFRAFSLLRFFDVKEMKINKHTFEPNLF